MSNFSNLPKDIQDQIQAEIDKQVKQQVKQIQKEYESKLQQAIVQAIAKKAPLSKTASVKNARPATSKPTPNANRTLSKPKVANGTTPTKKVDLAQSQRPGRGETPQSSMRKDKRAVSASPSRTFKPAFNQKEMAKEDHVDAIYDNKDPIATSIQQRGTITGVVQSKGGPAPFTFTFKLEGQNQPVIESKKKAAAASSGGAGAEGRKSIAGAKGPCPIASSIEERKKAGSIVSIANGGARVNLEIFEFTVQGKRPVMETTPSRKSKKVL